MVSKFMFELTYSIAVPARSNISRTSIFNAFCRSRSSRCTSSEPLYVCGDNKNGFTDKGSSSSDVGRFYAEGSKFSCSGDVMSLLDMNEDMTVIPCSYCFYQLFYQCNLLTSAPELPATVLKMGCYHAMFYGCTGLKASPYLPATSLADDCYYEMFYQCSSLVSTSALNATTLASHCYHGMFEFCTSLNSPPANRL